ncbi:lamina-associated polypeptide 2, isoforms alpha/zeta-like [Bufo gargarizans]|uniref:lamina-associated polypeptide 2, isoforms alpha/zeta-like n=1 Tax=Bufo gargarizans TaxID=30331 RepID=UPI001CF43F37|nr:lamina-associated polypeptide 2, isoforms alpha/zeta-like [Bufo gargarizans]
MVKTEVSDSLKDFKKSFPAVASTSLGTRSSTANRSDSDPLEDSDTGEILDSPDSSQDEESTGRPLFSPDDTEALLKAVRATMKVDEPKDPRSVQDIMFGDLGQKKSRVFPVNENIKFLIQKEWKRPDKKIFVPKNVKRKYPFDEADSVNWDRPPKLDAPVAKISKKSALPFEDLGSLKDPMDKRAEVYLKKVWETSAQAFKPNIAATSTARSLKLWLEELESHIQNKTPRDQLLAVFPTLLKAVDFISDASADALKLNARSAALSNSARRAIWLKGWSGDTGSKNKLCAIPCQGDYLFGSVLDDLLDKASDNKKGFPVSRPPKKQRFFRKNKKDFFRGQRKDFRADNKNRKSKGFLFSSQSSSTSKPSQQ